MADSKNTDDGLPEDAFERLAEHVATLHGVLSEMRLDLACWQDDAADTGRHVLANRFGHWQGALAVLTADIERTAQAELGFDPIQKL